MLLLIFLCFGLVYTAPQGYDYNAKEMFMQHIPLVMKLLSQSNPKSQSNHQFVPLESAFAQSKVFVEEPASVPKSFYLPVQQFIEPVHFEYPATNTIQPTAHYENAEHAFLQTLEPHAVHYEPSLVSQSPQYTSSVSSSNPAATSEYNKEFYFVSAEPENEYQSDQELQSELNKLRKNIRVVFIKSPENNGALDAAAKLIKAQQANQQSHIYVLAKQYSASDLANKLKEVHVPSVQPEVVFIKYRTPQEAEEAQRTIQAQYSELNGPNHFSYGNKATVQSFSTKAPEHIISTSDNHYLPPKK